MPQSSAAYESARDWRSAGGLFGEILLRCRPANPLTALRRHPEALARIEASLGRADFNAWGASVLTAFAADCAVWANEAFGQSLLACGLALMGDASAAAAALPQPAGLNPVEIDVLRQARRRTVFLGALAAAWEPITEITVEAGQGRADRWDDCRAEEAALKLAGIETAAVLLNLHQTVPGRRLFEKETRVVRNAAEIPLALLDVLRDWRRRHP